MSEKVNMTRHSGDRISAKRDETFPKEETLPVAKFGHQKNAFKEFRDLHGQICERASTARRWESFRRSTASSSSAG